ncbi:hypothetical protein [Cloacibacillus sp.]|uniref:hypothetical protein n=1 Tax=Cloacibacillus sp. TaxID=2049023 RepID=UPI0025C27F7A|nr:hypothetical protein [Cloacibacillus sp.]
MIKLLLIFSYLISLLYKKTKEARFQPLSFSSKNKRDPDISPGPSNLHEATVEQLKAAPPSLYIRIYAVKTANGHKHSP